MGLFSSLFGGGLKAALEEGSAIIDIRSAAEYDSGHVPGAHNIPVDRIAISIPRIKGFGKVIICGAGDSRNSQATDLLRRNGITSFIDGGSWDRVYRSWKKT
ncbi:MAG: rhodanese-like domain-containing protein [Chitinophagaceae bacterium]|nr:MAG: rhodanese-like domain-containing protein [Chitinophagaceae bacterium]